MSKGLKDEKGLRAPAEWPVPSLELQESAISTTLAALAIDGDRPVQRRLRTFYSVETDYAGASFATLRPVDPGRITATDLHAVALLKVEVRAGATRRLLEPGPIQDAITEALSGIPSETLLTQADEAVGEAMLSLYRLVKAALSGGHVRSPNQWVTASKLCARKRPGLFPVRDNDVCSLLQIDKSYDKDWALFRVLMEHPGITSRLDALPGMVSASAEGRTLHLDTEPLRLLGAALWTWTKPAIAPATPR